MTCRCSINRKWSSSANCGVGSGIKHFGPCGRRKIIDVPWLTVVPVTRLLHTTVHYSRCSPGNVESRAMCLKGKTVARYELFKTPPIYCSKRHGFIYRSYVSRNICFLSFFIYFRLLEATRLITLTTGSVRFIA